MTEMTTIEQALAHIRIVLVEPSGPLNIGAIARVMKNMGLTQLVLVNAQCDPFGPDARQMAVHANDRLDAARQVSTLPEALSGCQRALATTARDRRIRIESEQPSDVLSWLLAVPSALIFGPEDRGLSNAELTYAQRFVRIPTSAVYPSLNLAQAVTICCYELHQACLVQDQPPTLDLPRSAANDAGIGSLGTTTNSVTLDQLEAYYQHLEALLLEIGYLYPHTAKDRMIKLRRLFNRGRLSEQEVAMLRGILSQVEWKLKAN